MLDIKKVQSTNRVEITGILNELDIEEKMTADGRSFIQGKATIKTDQEISGKMVENEIPVKMFAMRKKTDGTDNPVYDGILRMREQYTSLGAAETPAQASRVTIASGNLQENTWYDKNTDTMKTGFNITSNFMRKSTDSDEPCAKFELSGVIGKITEETDKNGDETGRLLISFITVGYLGRAEVVPLIAENPVAVNHIKNNWEKGDTVSLTGVINMTYKTIVETIEQGFGEPKKVKRTESRRELLITGGSPSGYDEELSYSSDDIKIALDERTTRIEAQKEKAKTKQKPAAPKKDFGF